MVVVDGVLRELSDERLVSKAVSISVDDNDVERAKFVMIAFTADLRFVLGSTDDGLTDVDCSCKGTGGDLKRLERERFAEILHRNARVVESSHDVVVGQIVAEVQTGVRFHDNVSVEGDLAPRIDEETDLGDVVVGEDLCRAAVLVRDEKF